MYIFSFQSVYWFEYCGQNVVFGSLLFDSCAVSNWGTGRIMNVHSIESMLWNSQTQYQPTNTVQYMLARYVIDSNGFEFGEAWIYLVDHYNSVLAYTVVKFINLHTPPPCRINTHTSTHPLFVSLSHTNTYARSAICIHATCLNATHRYIDTTIHTGVHHTYLRIHRVLCSYVNIIIDRFNRVSCHFV